jgi:hypothetical protein
LLLAALLVSVGAPLLGSGTSTASGPLARPDRAVHQRAHLTSQSAGLPETGQRSTKRSTTELFELLAAVAALIAACLWVARRLLTAPHTDPRALQAPERAPPAPLAAI